MSLDSHKQGTVLSFPARALGENALGENTVRREEEIAPVASRLSASKGEPCSEEEYDSVFDRLSDRVQDGDRIAASEKQLAPIRYAELIVLPPQTRKETVARDSRFHSYLLAEMFLERSRESWLDDVQTARDAAEIALVIASKLDPRDYGSVLPKSLEIRCWAYLGNAFKIATDLISARKAFEQVDALMPAAILDGYEKAEILGCKVSYLKEMRQFEEAEALLDEITEIFRDLEDDHKLGRTLILRGVIQTEAGDFEKAIELFGSSMSLLDDSRDPRLVSCALTNLAHCMNEVGRSEEALSILRVSRRRIESLGDRIHLARARWTEGRIAVSLDRVDEAEAAFEEVREFFENREGEVDAALVCLELAMLYARKNDTAKVKALAREVVPAFRRQDLGQEVMAALILFQHAAEKELVTLGLLQEIVQYLERASAQDPNQVTQDL